MRRARTWLPLVLVVMLAACGTDRDPASLFAPQDVDVPVVDAILRVGEPLPTILLSRTQPADQEYSFREAAIRRADVRVVIAEEDTVLFTSGSIFGFYEPDEPEGRLVLPETQYSLIVITEEGERITAETTTPALLNVDSWVLKAGTGNPEDRTLRTFAEVGDGVYTAPENQLVYPDGVLEAQIDAVTAPGYQLSLFSLDLGSDFVVEPPFLDPEDLAAIERNGSSPVIEPDVNLVRLPWFAVFFQGRYLYKMQALDLNTYDLVRSTPQGGLGFGGNAGDNFERPIYHIEGGIGLFGSVAMDSVGFTVWPPD